MIFAHFINLYGIAVSLLTMPFRIDTRDASLLSVASRALAPA